MKIVIYIPTIRLRTVTQWIGKMIIPTFVTNEGHHVTDTETSTVPTEDEDGGSYDADD